MPPVTMTVKFHSDALQLSVLSRISSIDIVITDTVLSESDLHILMFLAVRLKLPETACSLNPALFLCVFIYFLETNQSAQRSGNLFSS